MVTTLCISGAALLKAGANVSTAFIEADYTQLINQAESLINVDTRFNWTDVYSTLDVDLKYILEDVCSSLAAMSLINYDTSGYTTRGEALTMLDVLDDKANKGLKILQDIKAQDFINV